MNSDPKSHGLGLKNQGSRPQTGNKSPTGSNQMSMMRSNTRKNSNLHNPTLARKGTTYASKFSNMAENDKTMT